MENKDLEIFLKKKGIDPDLKRMVENCLAYDRFLTDENGKVLRMFLDEERYKLRENSYKGNYKRLVY